MNRTILTTNFGENFVRYTVRIEADDSATDGQDGFRSMMTLAQTIAWSPDMLRHGGDCPESVRYFVENGHWVVEAVTVVPVPQRV